MTLTVARVGKFLGASDGGSVVRQFKRSPTLMASVKKGLQELHEGKGKSWDEVKKDFGWA